MKTKNWGLIGGGKGSQIGDAHRIGAAMDGAFSLVSAAPDIDPKKGKAYAQSLGIEKSRAHGTWQDMIDYEADRGELDLVTVATPNDTHFEISKACLNAGFHVLCEKPLTMSLKQAKELGRLARKKNLLLAVNFGYTGYPMVRQARAMVEKGKIGEVRLVVAQFAHGHHADAADMDNPRVRWRYDPKQAGVSSVLADCGIHAMQMATFVVGQQVRELSADFVSTVAGRELEDDAAVQARFNGGAVCRLWTSAVALGHMHGLTLKVFGEKGGLAWQQEQPNQLLHTPLGKPVQILERGSSGLDPAVRRASRIAIGHPEGMLSAFANIYRDLHFGIDGDKDAILRLPGADDGIAMVELVTAAASSAKARGRWVKLASGKKGA